MELFNQNRALRYMFKPLILCALILFSQFAVAQGCCSGMAPISANLGFPAASKNTWQVFASWDINKLATLKHGDERLEDNNRERITQSLLVKIGYSITERFSTDLMLVPVVNQTRIVDGINDVQTVNITGFGDMVILPKFLVTNPTSLTTWQIGLGVKAPTGKSDLTYQGLQLNADLQPGTGAWDLVMWTSFNWVPEFRKSMGISTTINFRLTGTNNEYLKTQAYEFGDDFHVLTAIADQYVLSGWIMAPSLGVRYRNISRSQIDENSLDNTGGHWVTGVASLGFSPWQLVQFSATGEIPFGASVDGIQLSSTYRLSFGAYLTIN